MLSGKVFDETTEILADMHASPFVFHLTGSRYFGTNDEYSDWDFFAEADASIVEWLDHHDFLLLSDTMYDDENTAMVMRRNNIDVQLQKNVALKCAVQEYIKETGLLGVYLREFTHLNSARKSYAKRVWNLAYKHFFL